MNANERFSTFTTETNNAVFYLKQTWLDESPDGFYLKLILLDGTNCWTGNCNELQNLF